VILGLFVGPIMQLAYFSVVVSTLVLGISLWVMRAHRHWVLVACRLLGVVNFFVAAVMIFFAVVLLMGELPLRDPALGALERFLLAFGLLGRASRVPLFLALGIFHGGAAVLLRRYFLRRAANKRMQ
jgi:hypothetical protein